MDFNEFTKVYFLFKIDVLSRKTLLEVAISLCFAVRNIVILNVQLIKSFFKV